MQYTTIEAVMVYGQFESSDAEDTVNALILSASRIISSHCRRVFSVDDETVHTFRKSRRHDDPFTAYMLLLDEDLAEDASDIADPDDAAWAPTVFYRDENRPPYWAIELEEGTWPQVVKVTGYWGYSKTPPPDIEIACLRLVKWLYDLSDTTEGQVPVVTPEGRVLLPIGLPSDVIVILQPYVKGQVGI